jgi:hypothetical protein
MSEEGKWEPRKRNVRKQRQPATLASARVRLGETVN